MEIAEGLDFARRNSHAVLTTLREDGSPQMSPLNVAVDTRGLVVISSRETAFKTRNLRRDPRAWLCVMTNAFYGSWVQLEGTVEVVSLPAAMDELVSYYRVLSGEHPDWADYRAAMVRDQRCLLKVTVTRAGPDRQG